MLDGISQPNNPLGVVSICSNNDAAVSLRPVKNQGDCVSYCATGGKNG
jgi:hypothetical protein